MYLMEFEQWQAASLEQKNNEIGQIIPNCEQYGLSFVGIKTFAVGEISCDIAVFYHDELAMHFHLLPGTNAYKVGVSPDFYAQLLDNHAVILDENDFEQRYPIEISPFFISDYLISEGAWKKFDGKALFRNFGDEYPIDAMSRHDIKKWAEPLGFRLPSEMEWEYACKAGTNSIYFWGNEPDNDYAWVKNNTEIDIKSYRTLSKAEQKRPNAFGLLGMLGNLEEWVADDVYSYQEQTVSQSPYFSFREGRDGLLRGGSFAHDWKYARSSYRADCAFADTGISARLVVSLNDVLNTDA